MLTEQEANERDDSHDASDEMLSMIAHDIRTPVMTIVGSLAFLAEERHDDTTLHLFSLVRRASMRLSSLADELDELGAAGSGNLALDFRPHRLASLVVAATEELRVTERAQRVELEVDCSGSFPVLVDGPRIGRAMLNLVQNALRHAHSKVVVRLQPGPGHMATVAVEDDGDGIPDDLLPRVFEPFVCAGRHGKRGLGLAITRAIARAHGGDATAENRAEGGARFELRLPMEAR
jgi:signal transduction histidine kinase